MGNTTFNRTTQHSGGRSAGGQAEMGFSAFVISTQPTEIFIVVPNFFRESARQRALTLIHEYIHLLFPRVGHPGGVQINFTRARMGIPHGSAVQNAYCYQCFADWLTGP